MRLAPETSAPLMSSMARTVTPHLATASTTRLERLRLRPGFVHPMRDGVLACFPTPPDQIAIQDRHRHEASHHSSSNSSHHVVKSGLDERHPNNLLPPAESVPSYAQDTGSSRHQWRRREGKKLQLA